MQVRILCDQKHLILCFNRVNYLSIFGFLVTSPLPSFAIFFPVNGALRGFVMGESVDRKVEIYLLISIQL